MNYYQRRAAILDARCALWVLLVAISSGSALAETGTEGPVAPAASTSVDDAVFPSAIDPKYEQETPTKARLHTCVDQYNANKANNANGGLKWIQRGGGYYSKCNKRLEGMSSNPAPKEVGGDGTPEGNAPEGDRVTARRATYTIRRFRSTEANALDESLACLYRDEGRLLCPATDWIRFDKHYQTKGYDLLVISTGYFGTGNRWHDWKLIVDDGRQAVIKPLAEDCLACDFRVEKLNYQSDEVVISHRQAKQLHTATFRAGQLTLRKGKLDPNEPVDENTCDFVLAIYEDCKTYNPDPNSCSMHLANSGHFALLRAEDQYAGISYKGMQQMCRAACSGGEAMHRKTFFKKVCRR